MRKYLINILSIEDNPGDFILLKEILNESIETKYNLVNCVNLNAGIEALKNDSFDIILLDLSLPDSNGLDSFTKLKTEIEEIPVIVMTGNEDDLLAKQAIREGAQDFLVKGHFDFSLISRAITYAIERKELERRLIESEKLYRGLIELSPNAILIHIDGIIKYVNSAALTLLGATDENQLLEKNVYSFIEASYHKTEMERVEQLESGTAIDVIEEEFIRLDGRHIFVEVVSSNITYKNQSAIQSTARDITEKIMAIESFIQQSKLNAEMAELAGNMLKAKTIDEITNITLSKAQQLTKSKFGFVAYIHPKTGYLVVPTLSQDIWNECKVENKTVVFEKFTGLWGWVLIHKKSLMTNQPEKDFRSVGTPEGHVKIKNIISVPAMHNKQLIGQITVANSDKDFTDHDMIVIERLASVYTLGIRRIQAVSEVIEREERFRLAFQYSNIGSVLVSPDKRLLRVNSTFCQMLGYTEDEILEKTFDELTWPEDLEVGQNEFKEMLEGRIDYTVDQKRYVRKDGQIIRAYISSTILRNEKQEPIYFITHIQDFTEKIEAEEKLKKSLSEKEALIRELFHRTKNNMQLICSLMDLKTSSFSDPLFINEFKEMQNRIKAMSLVHDKLYQSHNLSRIDLQEYLTDLVMQLFMRYKISSQKIKLNIELESITVLIDTAIPCGIFINELVSNAFKYAFPGERTGEVEISLKQIGEGIIELKVTDNGIGIQQEIEIAGQNTLGLKLLHNIAENQLQGDINYSNDGGFSCSVRFKDAFYSERV